MITPSVVPATPIEDPEIKKILTIELFDAPIVLRIAISEFLSFTNMIRLDMIFNPATKTISDTIIKEDKGIIEDLIVAAHNNAKSQLKSKTSEEISKATGGFGIPGFKWPL